MSLLSDMRVDLAQRIFLDSEVRWYGTTMSDLSDYMDPEREEQQATHMKLENPDHPESNFDEEDIEAARRRFKAATYLQRSGINREELVGDFLAAFSEAHQSGEEDRIEEILEIL